MGFSNSNKCTKNTLTFFSSINLFSIAEVSGSTTTNDITAVKNMSPRNISHLSSTTLSASTISAISPRMVSPRTGDDLNNHATADDADLSTDLVIDMDQVYIQ